MNPFDNDSYFEVKIPLTDEGIEILREVAPEVLKDYDHSMTLEDVAVTCTMTVAFEDDQTYFAVNTETMYLADDCGEETTNYIDLSDDVASYFKTQAILSVITQFSAMPETKSIINSFAVMRG